MMMETSLKASCLMSNMFIHIQHEGGLWGRRCSLIMSSFICTDIALDFILNCEFEATKYSLTL